MDSTAAASILAPPVLAPGMSRGGSRGDGEFGWSDCECGDFLLTTIVAMGSFTKNDS